MQQRLQLLIILARLGIQVQVTIAIHPIDLHLHLREIAQLVQTDRLFTHGQGDATINRDRKLRVGHALYRIFKSTDTAPCRPFIYCLARIADGLLNRKLILASVLHIVNTANGQFTSFWQVLITTDKRVDLMDEIISNACNAVRHAA